MRIFLYEFITGGGMFSLAPDESPSGSLLREGAAMFNSLAGDFLRIPAVEVVALRDERMDVNDRLAIEQQTVHSAEEESRRFDALSAESDWTVVIAPEFDNILLNRTRRVETLGGRLLGPCSEVVELGTNKNRTAAHFAKHGVATAPGIRFVAGSPIPPTFCFPAILKPADGAGSQNTTLVERRESMPTMLTGEYRLEELRHGTSVSVAVVSGPNEQVALPACQQKISADGLFRYLGGTLPIDNELQERAERLALQAAQTLPIWLGYIGFDLILGQTSDLDVIIEMNPRLTTSYVGLRQLARGNIAAAMIDLAEGKTPDLGIAEGPVEFRADGTIV